MSETIEAILVLFGGVTLILGGISLYFYLLERSINKARAERLAYRNHLLVETQGPNRKAAFKDLREHLGQELTK